VLAIAMAAPVWAADPVANFFDNEFKGAEHDIVGLAEAMPAAKYNFAPTSGEFKGVRTFALQVRHIATIIYMVGGAALNEKPPVDLGPTDNGPDTLKTKEQIVAYLKGAFAYGHKAIGTITAKNELEMVTSPFGDGKVSRLFTASIVTSHSFDHYGQMVVYARMNGVIPPSSLPAPPAAKK
jgi:hypothetical protein